MKQCSAFIILAFCFSISTFAQESDVAALNEHSSIELPEDLERVLRDYEEGWRNGDSEALAALFTPDGFIMRPRHAPVRGRENIEEAYRGSQGPLHLRAIEFSVEGSVGYILGGFSYAPAAKDLGKYILTLALLDDNRWYITADMDNSNQ